MRAGNLLGQDPPDHTRLRRMLTREFTQARMRRLQPRIAEIVDSRLDAMEQAGPPADLVADFALPIPSLVICELLGVPYSDRAEFQARSNRLLDLSRDPDDRLAAGRENREYMSRLCRRGPREPGRRHPRRTGPRPRRRPDPRRADRHRRSAADRRARDDVEHAGARHARAAAPPRAGCARPRRPRDGACPPSRSCMRFLSIVHSGVAPPGHARHRDPRHGDRRRTRWCSARCPPPTVTPS